MFAEKIFKNCQCWNFDGININAVTTAMAAENLSQSEYAPIEQTGGFSFRSQEAEINENQECLDGYWTAGEIPGADKSAKWSHISNLSLS